MERKRTIHGVTVGILMVKTQFRRFPGDVGNAETWNFPVHYKVVGDANPSNMTNLHKTSLLEPFRRAAQELIDEGVDGIATTCGFLSIYQRELADFCSVPVATSSLLQTPMVQALLPASKKVGVLTFSSALMNPSYLDAVGVPASTPIMGMPPDSEFSRSIREADTTVAFETLQDELIEAAGRLLAQDRSIGAIVAECTNMTPYSAAIAQRFGVPVYDAVSLINWFQAGLRPQRFG